MFKLYDCANMDYALKHLEGERTQSPFTWWKGFFVVKYNRGLAGCYYYARRPKAMKNILKVIPI